MHTLLENKNHIIDKLSSLTSEQKEEIKAFFLKHPSYENKIAWNNKSLSYEDFKPILKLDGKSKTQAKKRGIEGLVEDLDYKYLGSGYNESLGNYIMYQPLTYLGSKTLASNKVPPVKGNGAQWCIAYQKTDQYWKDYTSKGIRFVFVFTGTTKYAVTLYETSRVEVYSFADRRLRMPKWWSEDLSSKIPALVSILPSAEEVVEKYLNLGVLVKNENGTYSKIGSQQISAEEFIRSAKIAIPFDYWEGDFKTETSYRLSSLENSPKTVTGNFRCTFISRSEGGQASTLEGAPQVVGGDFECSFLSLVSLKGGPRRVGGNFDCSQNKLTSLEGAPIEVGGNFDCANNELTSLKGAPEKVSGTFNCSGNRLTSLEGAPKEVGKHFNCSSNSYLISLRGAPEKVPGFFWCTNGSLTSLIEAPKEVGRSFHCIHNRLTSLKGAPAIIGEGFYCSYNKLRSLKGLPARLKGDLYCSYNNLTSLEGAPKEVEGILDCSYNSQLTSLKGSPEYVESEFICNSTAITSFEGAPQVVGGNFYCGDTGIEPSEGVKPLTKIGGRLMLD